MMQVDGYNNHQISSFQRRDHGSYEYSCNPNKNSVFVKVVAIFNITSLEKIDVLVSTT